MTNEELQQENARLKVELRIKSGALANYVLLASTFRTIIIEAINPTTKLLKLDGSKQKPRSSSARKKPLPTRKG